VTLLHPSSPFFPQQAHLSFMRECVKYNPVIFSRQTAQSETQHDSNNEKKLSLHTGPASKTTRLI
jgi:hypothetical protein